MAKYEDFSDEIQGVHNEVAVLSAELAAISVQLEIARQQRLDQKRIQQLEEEEIEARSKLEAAQDRLRTLKYKAESP